MKIKKTLIILLLTILYTNCSSKEQLYEGLQEKIKIDSFVDKKASGWAYTTNQQAFVATIGECKISYSVSQFKDKSHKTALSSRRNCNKPFIEQIPIHKALLKKIFATYPNEEWGSLSWGSFVMRYNYRAVDWSWSLPIAKASIKSKEYRDYRLNYPNTPYNINRIFVKLANKTLAYRELKTIFNELGYDITLKDVEKVFTTKARAYKLYPVLKKEGIKPKQRLIYDIGMSYFKISKKNKRAETIE